MNDNKKQSFSQVISAKVGEVASDFWKWLKPNPADHWLIQILKSVAKAPLVILLILCSPILLLVLLVVFLIAI